MGTQRDETAQIRTRRAELGRPTPRAFTHTSWLRFARDRRRRYLARINGPVADRIAGQIEAMVRLEWQALKAASEGTLQGDRESREFTRLLERMTADFERSVAVASKPGPPGERFDEELRRLAERGAAA
jgi:hypothetical protein